MKNKEFMTCFPTSSTVAKAIKPLAAAAATALPTVPSTALRPARPGIAASKGTTAKFCASNTPSAALP